MLPDSRRLEFELLGALAYGTLLAVQARGARVPGDLLLVSTDTETRRTQRARPK
jgi:hypothetical protein